MPVAVQTEITIDRPVDRVAGYAADLSNAPEWYANIEPVEWKTQPPLGHGGRTLPDGDEPTSGSPGVRRRP